MNFFEFYNLPVSFEIDTVQLKTQFYEKSRAFHPDRFSLSDETAQENALSQSVINNQAYRTLNNPDLRMQYILGLYELLGEEGKQTPMPQDFLMDMMDINEAIMDLQMDFDTERLAAVRTEVDQMMQHMTADIQPLLSNYRESTSQTDDLKRIRVFFYKKKYLLRILENLSTFARR